MSVLTRTLVAAAVAGIFAAPAFAKIEKGEALSICMDESKRVYGDSAIIKLKKIKKRGDYKVELFVSGVSESRFSGTCVVDSDGKVLSMDPASAPE